MMNRMGVRWAAGLLGLALAVLSTAGCTTIAVEQMATAAELPLVDDPDAAADPAYRIRSGDDLDVKFFYTRELNESLKVRPDGYITLQLVDDVKAAGLTPKELSETLAKRFAEHIKAPAVSVIVRSYSGYRAYVGGEVAVPQVVPLEGGLTPLQAIFRVGGARPSGRLESVVLIRKGPDGRPMPYQLDLSDAAVSQGRRDLRVALQPSDVLYVPRSRIANANLFVQQYIGDLILFRGVQFGVNADYVHSKNNNTTTAPAN